MRTLRRSALLLAIALLWSAVAAGVTVAWDPNPIEERVTGYTVHWGETSRTAPGFTAYANKADVAGNIYEYQFPSTAFTVGKTYYIAATATNDLGLRSDYSTELKLVYKKPTAPGTLTLSVKQNADGTISVTVR